MKTPTQPGLTPLFVAAALLITPFSQGLAADRDPSQPPAKLGSRIVNFFKGLVDRDESPPSYNEYPPTRSSPPQGQGRQPRRFNLDAPPPIPGGSGDYDRENYDQPERPAPRPRTNPAVSPDEEYDPPVSRQGPNAGQRTQQDLPYESPPSEPAPPTRQKPVEPPTRRQEPSPSLGKTQTPKNNAPATPKPDETPSKPASGNHSPVTTTSNSPVTSPDSTPAPEPRRQEPTVADEPSTASNSKPSTPSPAASGAPLVGSKTAKPGRVKSPYPPYNELDVTGLSSGSLAMDPTTQKVFRVP
ncbi:hypothetical protein [Verrucomicrobium sp. BvORR034]|uniref:hypothetical protein n=1 Tax=Verrucomicrobium sp. BvORR034 TaxID=1396418 RepID=UPI000679189A|nr:hypothetical protein [Verrucomicrobium sp. BvORR034]